MSANMLARIAAAQGPMMSGGVGDAFDQVSKQGAFDSVAPARQVNTVMPTEKPQYTMAGQRGYTDYGPDQATLGDRFQHSLWNPVMRTFGMNAMQGDTPWGR